MIQWTEQFSTGSPQLDVQHQALIDNINELGKALLLTNISSDDYKYIVYVVDFLEHYARRHFHVEEQCMEQHRCPIHASNKAAHEQFKQTFSSFKQQWQAQGFRRELLLELHMFLSQWVVDHILQVDKQLRPCIKG